MTAVNAGRAEVWLGVKNVMQKGLRSALRQLKRFGKASARVLKVGFAAGATAATGFLAASIKAASDSEEIMNKFNVVFGESAKAVREWGDEFAAQVGRSENQVADFLASSQDLLVPMGIDPASAEESSKMLTQLAVDLASFNNRADADVMNDLQAAITGSGEVMKKYGVILNQTAINQELMNQGLDPKHATAAMKAQASMNIILRGTTAAQGDATRSAGSFANQMKALQATTTNLMVSVGEAILPMATNVITWLRILIENWDVTWALARDSALLSLVQVWENFKHIFTGVIPDILSWFFDNWQNLFIDMGVAAMTIVRNLATNITDMMAELWDFITSGFEGGFEGLGQRIGDTMGRDLLDGFEARTTELPQIAERQMGAYEQGLRRSLEQNAEKLAVAAAEAFAPVAAETAGFAEQVIRQGGNAAIQAAQSQSTTAGSFAVGAGAAFGGATTFENKMLDANETTAENTAELVELFKGGVVGAAFTS